MLTNTALFIPFGVNPWDLSNWSRTDAVSHDQFAEWVIPRMTPGPVTVCFGWPRLVGLFMSGSTPSPSLRAERCVEGDVPPGGELTLEIPEELVQQEYRDSVAGETGKVGSASS